jgi:hypothetical protein
MNNATYTELLQDQGVTMCAICGDTFSDNYSQLQPRWSEHHDSVLCVDCAERETQQ